MTTVKTVPSASAEVPPRVVRWAGWFLDARWPIATVAHLFDVRTADLRAAMAERRG